MTEPFVLHRGDCLDVLRTMPDNSVDSIVTDPPYGLSKEPDMLEVLRHWLAGDDYKHTGSGFMGKSWDSFVPGPSVWREALRVLKPGGHLLAFFGSRTYDMGTLAIRIAGFEIRDQIQWLYGSGFPKSLDVSKAIDKAAGADREVIGRAVYGDGHVQNSGESIGYGGSDPEADRRLITAPATDAARQWQGWGTALKPAHEPICVARKPLVGTVAANVLAYGTGALNIDACRVETSEVLRAGSGGIPCRHDENVARGRSGEASADRRYTEEGGTNFALKPGPRGGDTAGRWPANVIHDGSAEVLSAFAQFGEKTSGSRKAGTYKIAAGQGRYGEFGKGEMPAIEGDTGTAARFFYCAKASRADRNEGLDGLPERPSLKIDPTSAMACDGRRGSGMAQNHHPTVKPTATMLYLIRLVTPPGGVTLDMYMGSGSSGKAAMLGGFLYIGIERDEDEHGNPLGYMDIAGARITHARAKFEASRTPEPASTDQLDLLVEAAD